MFILFWHGTVQGMIVFEGEEIVEEREKEEEEEEEKKRVDRNERSSDWL